MRIKRVYLLSIVIGYLTFIICGIILMLFNSGWGKGFVLFITGGLFYIPVYAISNLTQFLLVKYPNRNKMAFFSSIAIMGIINLIAIQLNMMDAFIWKVFMPSQIIVSLFAFYNYKRINKL